MFIHGCEAWALLRFMNTAEVLVSAPVCARGSWCDQPFHMYLIIIGFSAFVFLSTDGWTRAYVDYILIALINFSVVLN